MKVVKGQVLPPVKDEKKLTILAKQLDQEIKATVKDTAHNLEKLASLLAKMKSMELWNRVGRFRRFEEYAQSRLGPIARGKVYELLAVHALTLGPNPVPAETVNQLGVKKAYEIERLKPEQRTPAVIRTALESSLPKVKEVVQEIINEGLPPEERREPLVLFSRNLPASTVALIEELEEEGVYMEGIRDGDTSVTLRSKLWHAIIVFFKAAHQEELAEARRYKKAQEAKREKEEKAAAPKKRAKKNGSEAEADEPIPPDPEEARPVVVH